MEHQTNELVNLLSYDNQKVYLKWLFDNDDHALNCAERLLSIDLPTQFYAASIAEYMELQGIFISATPIYLRTEQRNLGFDCILCYEDKIEHFRNGRDYFETRLDAIKHAIEKANDILTNKNKTNN